MLQERGGQLRSERPTQRFYTQSEKRKAPRLCWPRITQGTFACRTYRTFWKQRQRIFRPPSALIIVFNISFVRGYHNPNFKSQFQTMRDGTDYPRHFKMLEIGAFSGTKLVSKVTMPELRKQLNELKLEAI